MWLTLALETVKSFFPSCVIWICLLYIEAGSGYSKLAQHACHRISSYPKKLTINSCAPIIYWDKHSKHNIVSLKKLTETALLSTC